MKASQILINFLYKRRHNLLSELENGKIIEGSLHSFYLLVFFFFSLLTLCHFYFLVKNYFNPVQTGLCFAFCDREALRRPPSITSEPLMLAGHQKYYLIILFVA